MRRAHRGVAPAAFLVAVAAAVMVAGCGGGSAPGPHRPPAAEPAVSPPTTAPPAGRSVAVAKRPEGITADGQSGLVAVAVRHPAQIVLIAARSDRVLRRIAIPAPPRHLELAAPGGPLLVPEERLDHLLELNLRSGAYRSIAVGAHPHDAAAAAGRVFVSDEEGGNVAVVAGGREIDRIGGFVQPGGVAAVGPDIAVVDVGADTLTLIDARTLRVRGRLRAGSGPTHDAVGADGRVYVVDTRGDAVLAYATRPRLRLLGRVRVPGTPYGVASDPRRDRLWVTETATNTLLELDTRGSVPRVIARYRTGRQPNTVAVDPANGEVFVANASAQTVEAIRPRRRSSPSAGSLDRARSLR
jgi:hypothetical protein